MILQKKSQIFFSKLKRVRDFGKSSHILSKVHEFEKNHAFGKIYEF